VTDLQLGEIGINARRTLVLLSKALQSVSNATQFKESYMVPLTSLVTNNVAFVKKFFTEISKFTDTGVWADPIEHPPDEAIADVLKVRIQQFIVSNAPSGLTWAALGNRDLRTSPPSS
jgi:hypothetical protein